VDRLTASIPPGAVVGIDTVVFIYYLEAVPNYHQAVKGFFELLEQGVFQGVTSVITLMEIAVGPLQAGRRAIVRDYELRLFSYPHLTVRGINRRIARRAAELRARYRLRPADSLQVAAALTSGASIFLTNDRMLSRVTELRVLILDDFRASSS
jgi:predicted nucleic acid-binding protein